jgi:ABC-type tungstate transport system substrate-binding protein
MMEGLIPLSVVSTSGNSGILNLVFSFRCVILGAIIC